VSGGRGGTYIPLFAGASDAPPEASLHGPNRQQPNNRYVFSLFFLLLYLDLKIYLKKIDLKILKFVKRQICSNFKNV
jgi:hypothetical protein